ncbi:hypothetical protein ABFX02_13G117900 [Erythranthe guttata]
MDLGGPAPDPDPVPRGSVSSPLKVGPGPDPPRGHVYDAIAYIEELRNSVEELTDQILQMEATDEDRNTKFEDININDDDHEMKIAPEIEVNHICGTKIWIKIIVQKKRGRLTKLMEAISVIGFHLIDISITTSQQAILFTSSAEGVHGGVQDADQIKKFLLDIIRSI